STTRSETTSIAGFSAGQTGVEMEALAAVAGAALNVVDMGKALNPAIEVVSLRVVDKIGGKTGLASNKTTDADRPTVAILTVSDSRSAGDRADTATRLLAEAAEALIGARVVDRAIAPDDRDAIAERLRSWTEADDAPRLVLTTGGAGVGPRDVTPEATADVDEGLLELARARCLPGKPHAFLSRAIAGVAGRTLVVNLPGSPRGAVDTLRLMSDVLPHALDALRDSGDDHPPA
ncbi:MAG: molybdenum cofactor synthesis domain-containing protein, partial [Planctomycetota bacterium]